MTDKKQYTLPSGKGKVVSCHEGDTGMSSKVDAEIKKAPPAPRPKPTTFGGYSID